ncbi:MAG: helix-hairpin-helix domain-containing protein, partial [Gemmataceae bacterium]|nr:helix-hairpin-helix domain-containing protein [Gemmataceae bacterium]
MTTSTPFSPAAQMQADLSRVAQDLQLRRVHVEAVVQLLDEGNTVPFITRYRKERTGGMNEELIRRIQQRVTQLRQLNERKQTILRTIENQGQLTPELRQAILAADSPKRLEDLYLPYKPKKRSFASEAREKGLEPFALAIWNRDPVAIPLHDVAQGMVNPDKGLNSVEDVLAGARNILAEIISEQADLRGAVRKWLWDNAQITATRHEHLPPGRGQEFKGYFEFKESLQSIPPHRILAINRGERENVLKIRLDYNADEVRSVALRHLPMEDHPHRDFIESIVGDALSRLLLPGLEREIRRELTDFAMDHAVSVFARNLRSLLLQPPLRGKRILAIDPGLRAGCKLAALDEYGNLLHHDVIYPHPINRREEAFRKAESRLKLEEIIRKYQLSVIAIGNGTACRETEKLIADLITDLESRQFTGEPKIELLPQETAAPPASQLPAAETPTTPVESTATPVESTANSVEPTPTANSVEPSPTASEGDKSTLLPNPAVEETAKAPENTGVSPTSPVSETGGFVDKTGFVDTTTPGVGTAAQATETPTPVVETSATTVETSPTPVVETSATTVETSPTPVEAGVTPVAAGGVVVPPKREPKPLPALPKIDFSSLPPAPSDLAYCIVNEAGASDYSASEMAREEFPDLDAMVRGVISIGRRLQDPLAELVKIDPAHIGVGLYQHDIKPKHLRETLDAVIESCVNHVGVDLNTASVALLRYVSGFNALVAREVVEYRKQHGPFRTREQLQNVPGVGPARFTQAAGFLKIPGGDEPLDETWIHPESYAIARKILEDVGMTPNDLRDSAKLNELREKLKKVHPEVYAEKFHAGVPTVKDIFEALAKPSRDPRDELPPPVFRKNVLRLEDLQPGMELRGTVLNVVDFGVFVDVGLKDSGLVHISQMANRFIKNPYEVVSVNDVVTVWVRSVDLENKRVSLTMIPPGTERRPPGTERRPVERRGAPAEGVSEGRPARE